MQTDHAVLGRRERARLVIFEADTAGGKAFDVFLMIVIVVSVLLVMFESVPGVSRRYATQLDIAEWTITLLFTVEYIARLLTVEHPWRYARSPTGIIDLIATLPTYLAVIFPGAHSLLVIRSLRLLRVFRVFKMAHWLRDANFLIDAVRASSRKIGIFLLTILLINVIVGSTMYVIEGAAGGFDSMFRGVYWSIVTMSTVGFGDIAPTSSLGQVLASALMILGYSVIAVPTGIVSAEISGGRRQEGNASACPACGRTGHQTSARFCQFCGASLGGDD
jgi:voltage-gated potassium channel